MLGSHVSSQREDDGPKHSHGSPVSSNFKESITELALVSSAHIRQSELTRVRDRKPHKVGPPGSRCLCRPTNTGQTLNIADAKGGRRRSPPPTLAEV